jgi:hypothetical protein
VGLYAAGSAGMSYLFPRPLAAMVVDPSASELGQTDAPASAAVPSRYALEIPVSANGGGQILLGDFASSAEAAAHGQELVRTGVVASFRVVASP